MHRNQKIFAALGFALFAAALPFAIAADGVPSAGMPGGKYKVSPATLTDGDVDVLHLDSNGNLKVSLSGGSSSTQVQGTAATGSAPVGNPVLFGGYDSSANVVRNFPVGFIGNATGNVLALVGGKDGAGNSAIAAIETSTNASMVSDGVNAVLDTFSYSGVKTSNGVTAVQIFAGVAAKRVILFYLSVTNTSATNAHTFSLVDSNTGATVDQVKIPASGSYNRDKLLVLAGGADLQMKIDAGGSATDVTLTAQAVIK